MKYFGTDGIRGIYGKVLTDRLAYMTANALSKSLRGGVVVVGRDTRLSGEKLVSNITDGILAGGGSVLNLGIIPTPAVAYITQLFNADYGIVVSASHNPPEYNGIKIFNNKGVKLTKAEEIEIENHIDKDIPYIADNKRKIVINDRQFSALYEKALIESIADNLTGLKVVLDCSNGASGKVAVGVFRALGADTIVYNDSEDGAIINKECGALYPENLSQKVLLHNADIGFAFDGDADRIIAVDSCGNILDGDDIIYFMALDYLEKGILNKNTVVGTLHTNMGVEHALNELGINVVRTDIGDHYVAQEMLKNDYIVGGEQSGHIINRLYSNTGDGVLAGVILADLAKKSKRKNELFVTPNHYPQCNKNVIVADKEKSLSDKNLIDAIAKVQKEIEGKGRLLLRASGTEPKIRVMVEHQDSAIAEELANYLVSFIKK